MKVKTNAIEVKVGDKETKADEPEVKAGKLIIKTHIKAGLFGYGNDSGNRT